MEVGPPDGLHAAWPAGEVTPLVRVPAPGGGTAMSIERDEAGAHRIHAQGYGTSVLDPEAARLACVPADGEAWRWQRLLISHNLPFAAVLHGYEVLHASGVVLGDGVVALIAASGTGKTTLALELVGGGAPFVCDDVLALRLDADGGVRAFPGAGVLNVRPDAADRLRSAGIALAVEPGEGQELRASVARVDRALPLRAVCFLERGPSVPAFSVQEEHAAASLLGATFNLTLRTPDRLERHLDVSAAVARAARVVRARIPPGMGPAETAERLRAAL